MNSEARVRVLGARWVAAAALAAPWSVALGQDGTGQTQTPAPRASEVHQPVGERTKKAIELTRPREWRVQFEPGVWFVAPAGDARIGGGGSFEFEDVDLDDPRAAAAGELHMRFERLTISLSGFHLREEDDVTARAPITAGALNIAAGQNVGTDFRYGGGQATGGWALWTYPRGRGLRAGDEAAQAVTMRLDAYGGVRIHAAKLELESGGLSANGDGVFPQPIVGTRLELEIAREFTIDLALDAGYWPGDEAGSTSVSVVVGFQWRPWWNLGVQIGFRQMFVDLRDEGDFEWDGSVGGLQGGVVLRF